MIEKVKGTFSAEGREGGKHRGLSAKEYCAELELLVARPE